MNKRGYKGLSFEGLELDFEGHLKVNIEFFNENPLFWSRI